MLRATNVARDSLLSLGTCIGKFTKTGKFRLHVTALDQVGQYAQYKIWIKPNGEMPFLYGNHVLKAHVGRMSEDIEQYSGVVIYNMADVPLVHTLGRARVHRSPLTTALGTRRLRTRRPAGIWRRVPLDRRVPQARANRHRRVPSGRHWRVPTS